MGVIRISDDRKRELTFGSAPGRVVSLVPSDTYNVAALGCGAALVARTDYCELPEDLVKRLPSIGGTKNPKVEAIIDLAPDLVIANQEENSKGDIEKLINRGLRVYVAFPKRASEGIAHLARLARIFRIEREPAARTLLKRGYDVIREAEEARKRVDGIRTFCPIWMKPLMTINGETFISDVLHLAGAENVFADRKRRYPLAADLSGALSTMDEEGRDTRYPRITEDELIARAPELVLLPDEPHPFTEADADVFRKLAIPAASRGAVLRMSGKDLCWYGARTIEGLPRVRALVEQHGKRALA
jgi:ABC-type Fe3+-hydroxamate transport system substrate-binding protein